MPEAKKRWKHFNIASVPSHAGRGTLRSMPMHFSRDANTGAAHVTFPLTLTKARALTPSISLNYHGNHGNSVFGIGVDLSGVLNITRGTHQGGVPRYEDDDIFILSNAGELVKISDANEQEVIRYRPRIDTQFSIIEYHVADKSWLIKEANGVNHRLGSNDASQVNHTSRGIYQWWVNETYDAHGNKIHYAYDKKLINNTVSFYLTSVEYGHYRDENNAEKFAFSCTLDYGAVDALEKNASGAPLWKKSDKPRPDQFTHYRAGFGMITQPLCRRILLHHALEGNRYLVKYWNIDYQTNTPLSLVKFLQEIGCRSNSQNEYVTKALPAAVFDFFALNETPVPMQSFDLGRDIKFPGQAGTYQWVDLYRDGLPGILYSDEFTAWYWRSEGQGKFSLPKKVSPFAHDMEFGSSHCRVMHLGNEKKTALVISDNLNTGYYLLDEEKLNVANDQYNVALSPYQYFTRTPAAFIDPDSEMLDLTGTGKSDVVVFDAIFPHYHPASDNIGEGYTSPKSLTLPKDFPRNHYDANAHITFEDIFGDGLLHRVKVSRDGIDIWPNLGHGCFSTKIHWDLPKISGTFDPARVFFTDVDGSGACDFVYATKNELLVFLNHGQGFSSIPTHTLILPEGYTQHDQLLFGDLLGQGVNGVIFIKKDVKESRYYSGSFATTKPYLLREMQSSTGVVTTFNYDTSITSYIKDRNNSQLASIRLPFALPVLSEMTVKDPVTQVTIEKTYQYHYGEYDFLERQFCGFAYVEATRHEYIARNELNTKKTAYPEPIQKALTKSWYYNRAIDEALHAFPRYNVKALTNAEIGQHYFKQNETTEGVTFNNSKELLNNTDLNREAHFSLHGRSLGHETWGRGSDYFGKDFGALEPLDIQIEQYNIRCDKTPASYIQHGIFVIQSREHYRFVYNQQNDLPRISRVINLTFDDQNRILMNAKLDYGRHTPLSVHLMDNIVLDSNTVNKLQDLQNTTHALCHQLTYAHVNSASNNDFQYLQLASEQKTFDLSDNVFISTQTFSDIKTLGKNSTQLIQHHQQYYWDEEQTNVAPLGNAGSLALTHHQCSLLGTQDQVQAWYPALLKITEQETIESMLIENGYLNNNQNWWQPDVIKHYGDVTHYYQLTAISNMTEYDRLNQPSLFQRTTIQRDAYQLAVVQANQFLSSEKAFALQIQTDYQSMKPCHVIDHNQNNHIMLYDPLHQLMAETKYGQLQGEWIGNPITENSAQILTATQLSDIAFAMSQQFDTMTVDTINENSAALLGQWLSVYYYHYSIDKQQPRYNVKLTQPHYQKRALAILNETPNTPIGMTIHYIDGFDHPVQTKQRTDEVDLNKRWLSSGIEIHSRTGKSLRQSLPSFSASTQCDTISIVMDPTQSLANEYDAAGELIQQTLPNGDQRQLLRTPWYEVYYDQNAMQNKRNGNNAHAASTHIHFKDAADNATGRLQMASENMQNRYKFSHSHFDVLGRPITHQDARLSIPNLIITYDLLGQEVSHVSVDRGQETFLHNYEGTRTRRRVGDWSHHTEHDSWQRPIALNVYSETQAPKSIESWQYGETLETPENTNACGEVIQFTNEESIFRQDTFNLDGHCLQSQRTIRLPSMNMNIQKTLENHAADWQSETFFFKREYDVAGNVLAESLPDGRIITHTYNALMQLQTIQSGQHLDALSTITHMTYQEAGFLATRTFGNNVVSYYNYDQQTQRLTSILSKNKTSNDLLQDHTYTFDPVGNITRLKLGELKLPIKQNVTSTLAENTLNYTYDDYYRLSSAQGIQLTEKTIVSDARVIPQTVFSEEAQLAIQPFTQTFAYDIGDNLTGIQHFNDNPSPAWQLGFAIQDKSNQFATLTSTINNEKIELEGKALYDAAGNMQKIDEKTDLSWDHTNQLKQFNDTEKNVKEYYAYRGTAFQEVPFTTTQENQTMVPYNSKFFGQAVAHKINTKPFAEYANRLYKISCFEKADNTTEVIEQVFLDNYERKRIFEIANDKEAMLTFIRHTLRIRDEDAVFATQHVFEIDQNAQESDQVILQGQSPLKQWEYHLIDHLHSSLLDLDDQGNVLSLEAYQPYGQIAFIQTRDAKQLSKKNYHYSSQMRDHVSGLYYYGARYYAPQFGRWLAPDPAGMIDGLNVYAFVKDNAINFIDAIGNVVKVSSIGFVQINGFASFPPSFKELGTYDKVRDFISNHPSDDQNYNAKMNKKVEKYNAGIHALIESDTEYKYQSTPAGAQKLLKDAKKMQRGQSERIKLESNHQYSIIGGMLNHFIGKHQLDEDGKRELGMKFMKAQNLLFSKKEMLFQANSFNEGFHAGFEAEFGSSYGLNEGVQTIKHGVNTMQKFNFDPTTEEGRNKISSGMEFGKNMSEMLSGIEGLPDAYKSARNAAKKGLAGRTAGLCVEVALKTGVVAEQTGKFFGQYTGEQIKKSSQGAPQSKFQPQDPSQSTHNQF